MPNTQIPSPRDFTGHQKAVNETAAKEAQQQTAQAVTLATAAREQKNREVQVVGSPREVLIADPDNPGQEIAAPEKMKKLRVNTDLENVTIGWGNNYSFFVGQKYKVPQHVYDHLEEKGYVWH